MRATYLFICTRVRIGVSGLYKCIAISNIARNRKEENRKSESSFDHLMRKLRCMQYRILFALKIYIFILYFFYYFLACIKKY